MAGETVLVFGTSFATLQAAASTADGAFSTGTRTSISAAITTGSEDEYPLLDLKLDVSVGTPTEGGIVNVYLRGDADEQEPAPAGDFKGHYLGSFVMRDAAPTTTYYLYGVPNLDPAGTLTLENQDGTSTLTIALSGRGRTYKALE